MVLGCMDIAVSTWFVMRACASVCSPADGSQTLRSTRGIGARPAFAAHQSSRRSSTFCWGEAKTTFQGPVVTGQPLAGSKCLNVVQSWPWKMCLGTM